MASARRQPGDAAAPDVDKGAMDGRPPDPLRRAWRAARGAVGTVAVFSLAANLLLFVVPVYMLQIYDRVVTSRNEATLVALSVTAAFLLVVYAVLEMLRARILVRVGLQFDGALAASVFDAVHRGQLAGTPARGTPALGTPALGILGAASGGQALRDVDTLREFLTGAGLLAFCDAPWFPIFVAAAFLMHPLYGWVAVAGSVVIIALTLLNEIVTRRPLRAASRAGIAASQNAQSSLRNGEVLRAMGMLGAVRAIWQRQHDEQLRQQAQASDRAGVLVAATRGSRMLLQVAILGCGAYLAIGREVSPGSIVAASILVGRALQPIELLVTHWKGFVAARGALARIRGALGTTAAEPARMALPRPAGALDLEAVAVAAPGETASGRAGAGAGAGMGRNILHDVSFRLAAGEMLAVIGPSAAGKSTLVRAITGIWPASAGTVRLDGHDIGHWRPEALGGHIGYLPQGVELFAGTVAENIARFQEIDAEPVEAGQLGAGQLGAGQVLAAARLAGCHEMIQKLPDGYDTQIGDGGRALSGGQRQRIGLARALYGTPSLVVLDEPNASLDAAGEEALSAALAELRARGVTTIVVSHALSTLSAADQILLLRDGRVQGFGPREAMLAPRPGAALTSSPEMRPPEMRPPEMQPPDARPPDARPETAPAAEPPRRAAPLRAQGGAAS
jgi:ATP-binding cassette subfamily C protein